MGTSSSYGGPKGSSPLIPTWLLPQDDENDNPVPLTGENISANQPIELNRFRNPRSNFSKFLRSGGNERANLGRSLGGYVSKSLGGTSRATQRMGIARSAGTRLLNVLTTVQKNGIQATLHVLNLEEFIGRSISDIFLGLIDYICPKAGTLDENIAREAFIETIADISESEALNLENLTVEQIDTIFQLYVVHTIEARLYNDIGNKIIIMTHNSETLGNIQIQIHDFICNVVKDAIFDARADNPNLTQESIINFVDETYLRSFQLLEFLAEKIETEVI